MPPQLAALKSGRSSNQPVSRLERKESAPFGRCNTGLLKKLRRRLPEEEKMTVSVPCKPIGREGTA